MDEANVCYVDGAVIFAKNDVGEAATLQTDDEIRWHWPVRTRCVDEAVHFMKNVGKHDHVRHISAESGLLRRRMESAR